MPESGNVAKVCVLCGRDVSGEPRVKDPKGRYSCKKCLAARQGSQSPRAAEEPSILSGLGDDAIDTAGLAAWSSPQEAAKLPTYGVPNETRSSGELGGGAAAGKAVAGALGKAALFGAQPIFWVVGGVIGGGLGAGLWALVTFFTHYSLAILIIGVGVGSGVGVLAGARMKGNFMTGVVAVIIAIAAIGAGKFWTVSMVVDKELAKFRASSSLTEVTDEDARLKIAFDIVKEHEAKAETLTWPEGVDSYDAEKKEDFPPGIWDEAEARWASADVRGGDRAQLKEISAGMDRILGLG